MGNVLMCPRWNPAPLGAYIVVRRTFNGRPREIARFADAAEARAYARTLKLHGAPAISVLVVQSEAGGCDAAA
jgi:hypothetical protein